MDATWPPARLFRLGPWCLRDGAGGGQRVSAATAEGPVQRPDIAAAEDAMRAMEQTPLFMLREGEEALDSLLAAEGYALHDPVALYTAPITLLTSKPVPPVSAFTIWPPLAIQYDLWTAAGIGAPRQAVMARAAGPKTAVLARQNDRPAGTAFAACDGKTAMVHAIETVPSLRRLGVGTNMLRAAAHWAQDQGMTTLALAVTRANDAACGLYSSLGMQVAGYYHYRIKQGREPATEQS